MPSKKFQVIRLLILSLVLLFTLIQAQAQTQTPELIWGSDLVAHKFHKSLSFGNGEFMLHVETRKGDNQFLHITSEGKVRKVYNPPAGHPSSKGELSLVCLDGEYAITIMAVRNPSTKAERLMAFRIPGFEEVLSFEEMPKGERNKRDWLFVPTDNEDGGLLLSRKREEGEMVKAVGLGSCAHISNLEFEHVYDPRNDMPRRIRPYDWTSGRVFGDTILIGKGASGRLIYTDGEKKFLQVDLGLEGNYITSGKWIVHNNELLIAGTYGASEKQKGIVAKAVGLKETIDRGHYLARVDLSGEQIDIRHFPLEEAAELDPDAKGVRKNEWLDLECRNIIPRPDGGYYIISEQRFTLTSEYEDPNGNTSTVHVDYAFDLIVLSLDSNAEKVSENRIYKHAKVETGTPFTWALQKNDLHLIYSDHSEVEVSPGKMKKKYHLRRTSLDA